MTGIKKWFMLQIWRIQQIAQILSLVMLAFTNALLLYGYMEWREGSFFSTPYVGVSLLLLVIAATIWIAAFIWDMGMKMWREQHSVLVEKNPYTKEKMTAKEIAVYAYLWLPMMDRLGKDDPEVREAADTIKKWLLKAYSEDKSLVNEVKEITDFIGKDAASLEAYLKK